MNDIRKKVKYCIWWLLHEWLFDFLWFLSRLVAWVVSDLKITGMENIPRKKMPVIVTMNHLSMWDLTYLQRILPRSFFAMTKEEFLDAPLIGGFVRLLGAFPVKRGTADRRSLQYCADILKKQGLLVIFPEGHRSDNYALQEGHPGAALVALNSQALIVPVGISGSEYLVRKRKGLFSRPKVTVIIGEPYRLTREVKNGKKESLIEVNKKMMGEIAGLLPPEYQGVYSQEKQATTEPAAF